MQVVQALLILLTVGEIMITQKSWRGMMMFWDTSISFDYVVASNTNSSDQIIIYFSVADSLNNNEEKIVVFSGGRPGFERVFSQKIKDIKPDFTGGDIIVSFKVATTWRPQNFDFDPNGSGQFFSFW